MFERTQTPAARPAGAPSEPLGRARTRAAIVDVLPGDRAARAVALVDRFGDVRSSPGGAAPAIKDYADVPRSSS